MEAQLLTQSLGREIPGGLCRGKQGENPLHTEGIPAHPGFSNVEVPSSLGS